MLFNVSIVDQSLIVAQYELGQVARAHALLSTSIDAEIKIFLADLEEQRKAPHTSNRDFDDWVDSEYGKRCDLKRINNYSGVVLAYAVFERFLLDVFNSAKVDIHREFTGKQKSLNFGKYKAELKRLNIDIESEPFDVSAINSFNRLRNDIMHWGGERDTSGRWEGEKYVQEDEIRVPDENVHEFLGLVSRTCQLIAEKYKMAA